MEHASADMSPASPAQSMHRSGPAPSVAAIADIAALMLAATLPCIAGTSTNASATTMARGRRKARPGMQEI
jgi:hypothetical protein